MPVPRTFAAAILAISLLAIPAYAEVGEMPETPDTAAYVNEIDTDWVIVSINTGILPNNQLAGLEDKIYSSPEIWSLAEFACRLYNRQSVLLSHSYEGDQNFVTRIDYLFACAIP